MNWEEFLKDESGQDIVEYALLMTLIGVAAILVLTSMGTSVSGLYQKLTHLLDTIAAPLPQ